MNVDESDSLRSAATVLASLPLATVDFKPFDLGRLGEKGVHAGLSGALKRARSACPLELKDDHKYIIFSDHHRGTREGNDDFQYCEDTYGHALDYYLSKGYCLIILGDGEECQEDDPGDILDAYSAIFDMEAEFHKADRYIRISGNHDAIWESEAMVRQHLYSKFQGLKVHEGVVFNYSSANRQPGELFLVHGHQGTLDSTQLKPLSGAFLRNVYRPYQQITGGGRTTPATNVALRAAHDTQIYRWSKKQRNLIVIAGHTHRPVWASRTHLEKLVGELNELLDVNSSTNVLTLLLNTVAKLCQSYGHALLESGNTNPRANTEQIIPAEQIMELAGLMQRLEPGLSVQTLSQLVTMTSRLCQLFEPAQQQGTSFSAELTKEIALVRGLLDSQALSQAAPCAKSNQVSWDQVKNKIKEIKEREYKYPSGGDSIKTEPCYFNTGCCRFRDGDITGIELAEGTIRLVRWGKSLDDPHKRILEQTSLDSVFRVLKLTRSGVWELGR
ncbi:MAG: metallophosphoesterase [Anaerolineae bacterium]